MKNLPLNFALGVVLLAGLCTPELFAQLPGGREPEPKTNPETKKQNKRAGTRSPDGGSGRGGRGSRPAPASFSLSVTPPDSTIVFDGTTYRADNGSFSLDGLKAGAYEMVVRRDGYREREYEVVLEAGRLESLSVSLEALRGTLTVNPGPARAKVSVVDVGTNGVVGTYVGGVSELQLLPGRYQVFASMEGYKTAIQEVTVKHSQDTVLRLPLEPLPRPTPAPAVASPPPSQRRPDRPSFRPDVEMRAQTSVEGKFVVVTLDGRSGDTSNAFGAVAVTLARGGGQGWAADVTGMLTGHPCQIDFVRLENVAEYSFAEAPGAANQWSRAVLRVRPKDGKRPVRFLLNWKGI